MRVPKPRIPGVNARRVVTLLCAIATFGCTSPGKGGQFPSAVFGDLSIYRVTNDQKGHEWVKTEEFLVPVGRSVVVRGLQFDRNSAILTAKPRQVLTHVFNSLEEITENSVGDTNAVRVAEFRGMRFEVCGYAGDCASESENVALGRQRAEAVMGYLFRMGTPAWRLQARGYDSSKGGRPQVEFVRIR